MFYHLLWIISFFLAVVAPRALFAEEVFRSIDFHYSEDGLILNVHAAKAGSLSLRYTPVNRKGKPQKTSKTKQFDVVPGENDLLLKVGPESGHYIRLSLDTSQVNIFANRGVWFSSIKDRHAATSRMNYQFDGVDRVDDVMLAAGFNVSIGRRSGNASDIAVGRTLGFDSGYGLLLDNKQRVLVLIAKSTVGPVTITISQRLNAKTVQYWDYNMVLGPRIKRYEIPLKKFKRRGKSTRPLTSIHSVSLNSFRPVNAGDKIAVKYFGLSSGGPFVSTITRDHRLGSIVEIEGASRQNSFLYFRDKERNESTLPLKSNKIRVPENAREVWVCYSRQSVHDNGPIGGQRGNVSICDPPDAPMSTYGVITGKDDPLIVDRFETQTQVNSFRMPVVVFGSSAEVENGLTMERLGNGLRITYYPDSIDDYAGYLTYLPKSISKDYETLAVTLRGSIPPNYVLVGVQDSGGKEARIPIISYWRGDQTAANPLYDLEKIDAKQESHSPYVKEGFYTVLIPIDAFRAAFYNVFKGHAFLKDISAISVTMTSGGSEVFHEIELRRVAFLSDISPISITAFDGDQYGINALGGVIFSEHDRGGLVDVRLNADGYYGKGLRVEITLDRNESYGLVALGFGKLDVNDYNSLSFYVRGEHGNEDAVIYLNDGHTRASVHLKDYVGVTSMWQKVTIPLSAFKEKIVDVRRLSQLILAWEEQRILGHIIYFDNFTFE
ncbi:MAG: hypothetical protein GY847_17390 [Proteobacteria bacterium]|nr:hypothetical protein [Pseudomonadota bacterium]